MSKHRYQRSPSRPSTPHFFVTPLRIKGNLSAQFQNAQPLASLDILREGGVHRLLLRFEITQLYGLFDQLVIPDEVQNTLVAKGLVRRFRNGDVEITLGGIREVTRRPLLQDTIAEGQWEASPA